MLTTNHSIFIYASRKYWWTPDLPYLGKYLGYYACSNFGSPGRHFQATVVPKHLAPHSNCHISYFTPPIEVFLSILESTRYKLRIAGSFTLMTPSLHRWEAFPTPWALTHTKITWALSPTAPQNAGVILGSPLCPWCFGHSSWKGARHSPRIWGLPWNFSHYRSNW